MSLALTIQYTFFNMRTKPMGDLAVLEWNRRDTPTASVPAPCPNFQSYSGIKTVSSSPAHVYTRQEAGTGTQGLGERVKLPCGLDWEVSRCPCLVGLNQAAGSSSCPFRQKCLQSCYCFP